MKKCEIFINFIKSKYNKNILYTLVPMRMQHNKDNEKIMIRAKR